MIAPGRSVRLFLVDGVPNGVMTAEVVNWTGHLLLAPRSRLAEVMQRAEAQKTGVYLLFGDIVQIGDPRPVYVGESDNVGRRILQHSKNEDREFEKFCIITSKDLNLTKAHARFLENRLSNLARNSGRAHIQNVIDPAVGILPESDVADMEYFVEQVRLVLPVLGFDILRDKFVPPSITSKEVVRESETKTEIVPLVLRPSRKGLHATAVERDGEIIVRKGSLAELSPEFAMNQYASLRERLRHEKKLIPNSDNTFLVFEEDVLFASPSAAAAVIYGRNANGRTSWMVADMNRTLKSHQEDRQAAE